MSKATTLEEAVAIFKLSFESRVSTVLEADNPVQIEYWESQKGHLSNKKKLKIKLNDSNVISESSSLQSLKARTEISEQVKENKLFDDAIKTAKQYLDLRKKNVYNKVGEVCNDKAQVDHWKSQLSKMPSTRTLLVTGTMTRDVFLSPVVAEMKRNMEYTSTDGQLHHKLTKSELDELTQNHNENQKKQNDRVNIKKADDTIEGGAARKAAGIIKQKAMIEGKEQQNPKESNSIRLFIEFLNTTIPENGWEFKYPFDFLQPDLLVRHSSWKMGEYIMVQIKSAGIRFGLSARYYRGESEEESKEGLYDEWIYCVGLGIRNYQYVEKPLNINDTIVKGSSLYDIIDVGRHLGPVNYEAGMKLDSVDIKRHHFVNRDIVDEFKASYLNPTEFVHRMFEHWSEWPRYDERVIYFDTITINKKMSVTKKIELAGIARLFDSLLSRNINLLAPQRQGETVDTYINLKDHIITISNKTAGSDNSDGTRRNFNKSVGKNSYLCNWVIASYPDTNYQKVAVVPASMVYAANSAEQYSWNDSKSITTIDTSAVHYGVVLFNLESDVDKLIEYLSLAPTPPPYIPRVIESRPKRAKTSNGQTSNQDFLALPTTLSPEIAISSNTERPSIPDFLAVSTTSSPVIAISHNTEMPGSQPTHYYGTTDSDN